MSALIYLTFTIFASSLAQSVLKREYHVLNGVVYGEFTVVESDSILIPYYSNDIDNCTMDRVYYPSIHVDSHEIYHYQFYIKKRMEIRFERHFIYLQKVTMENTGTYEIICTYRRKKQHFMMDFTIIPGHSSNNYLSQPKHDSLPPHIFKYLTTRGYSKSHGGWYIYIDLSGNVTVKSYVFDGVFGAFDEGDYKNPGWHIHIRKYGRINYDTYVVHILPRAIIVPEVTMKLTDIDVGYDMICDHLELTVVKHSNVLYRVEYIPIIGLLPRDIGFELFDTPTTNIATFEHVTKSKLMDDMKRLYGDNTLKRIATNDIQIFQLRGTIVQSCQSDCKCQYLKTTGPYMITDLKIIRGISSSYTYLAPLENSKSYVQINYYVFPLLNNFKQVIYGNNRNSIDAHRSSNNGLEVEPNCVIIDLFSGNLPAIYSSKTYFWYECGDLLYVIFPSNLTMVHDALQMTVSGGRVIVPTTLPYCSNVNRLKYDIVYMNLTIPIVDCDYIYRTEYPSRSNYTDSRESTIPHTIRHTKNIVRMHDVANSGSSVRHFATHILATSFSVALMYRRMRSNGS